MSKKIPQKKDKYIPKALRNPVPKNKRIKKVKKEKVQIPKGPQKTKSIDIAFLCDLNGANKSYFELVQNSLGLFFKELKVLYPSREIKFGFVGFRQLKEDDSEYKVEVQDFIGQFEKFKNYVRSLKTQGDS